MNNTDYDKGFQEGSVGGFIVGVLTAFGLVGFVHVLLTVILK